MKILKAKTSHPQKLTIAISDCNYIKTMTPLKELLNGEELINPIEVKKNHITEEDKYGANGKLVKQKQYSSWRGSQRIQAALQLGYTHIEAIVINE